MANWNDIKTNIGNVANKTVKKAGELADTASLHFKYKTSKAKLSENVSKQLISTSLRLLTASCTTAFVTLSLRQEPRIINSFFI